MEKSQIKMEINEKPCQMLNTEYNY